MMYGTQPEPFTSDHVNYEPIPLPQYCTWLDIIGQERSRRVTIHQRDIRRFLDSIGASQEQDLTANTAKLFYQTLIFDDVNGHELPADGSPIELAIPHTGQRSVGGSSDFSIFRNAIPGETLTIRSVVRDIFAKMGGTGLLYFIQVETMIQDESQATVAKELATYIRRD